MSCPLALIVAVAENGVIGAGNSLPWHLGSDLRRFKALTMGKPVLMGRKTYESIPRRAPGPPLPGRRLVVMTRDAAFAAEDVKVAHDLGEALVAARALARESDADEIMVAGGAEVFAQTLPLATCIHLTLVRAKPAGDVVFPLAELSSQGGEFEEVFREDHPAGPRDDHAFTLIEYMRKGASANVAIG